MKRKILIFSLFVTIAFLLVVRDSHLQQNSPQRCPLNPVLFNPPSDNFGLIPHPVDMSHIQKVRTLSVSAPSAWDWRDHNGVTPVKNQSTCGSCWAFASMGALESKVLLDSGITYDFSEENLKECNYLSKGCGGGNAWTATNYFTRQGTVLESCDPFHPYDTDVCKDTCSKIKQVSDWRILANDEGTIKDAVYQYGPCYTTMYASFAGFSTYDGSYVLYYTGSESPNHAVLIVGWDDNMAHAGGSGAWICKNSWGTGWGDNGYFYIAYGSASIGEDSCYYETYKHYDYLEMTGTLYHYDEAGWYDNWGFGSPNDTAWGLVKFVAQKDDCIHAVDFWAVDNNMQYTIYIYDDFNGIAVSNLIHSQSGSCAKAGYYSVELTTPIWVSHGDDFVVAMEFTCSGYYWPVPCDRYAPIETQKTYLSPSGANGTWIEMGSAQNRDVAIRARTKNHIHVFAGHDFDGDGSSDISLFRPSNGFWYLYSMLRTGYGIDGDIPVNGDYDGNGISDIAIFRSSTGMWAVRGLFREYYGLGGDIPVPADYNGDNSVDIAVFRPSTGMWAVKDQFKIYYGLEGDIPIPGDYNGDGTTDIAVFRPSIGMWAVKDQFNILYGQLGDIPVQGDYDGNGTTDIAIFRPSTGKWAVKDQFITYYGNSGDIPVPGDYDGNGMTDIAIFRPSTGMWAVNGQFRIYYGTNQDIPLVK